ncbi:hypothetical protein C8R45DRAFT_1105527 [Mycena sanguinolenta]|nr:hypothetical protein C8R45DRAFT_1105527 [Mycena sanguinolenta]
MPIDAHGIRQRARRSAAAPHTYVQWRGARRGGAGLRFVANAYSSASGDELEVPPIHSLKAKMFGFAMPGVWIALDITAH